MFFKKSSLYDATRPFPAQVPGGGGAAQTSSQGAAGLVVTIIDAR